MSTAARPRIRISGAFGEPRHIDAPPGLFASTMSRPARTFSERFVIIRNRSQLAISLNSDDCIGVWDLDTGELVERITSPRIHGERILGSSASGRYLLVHAADWRGHVAGAQTRAPMTYRIAIYDLMRGRWIAACLVPSDHAMRDIHLWLAPGDAELVMQSTLDSGEELLLRWNVADVTSE